MHVILAIPLILLLAGLSASALAMEPDSAELTPVEFQHEMDPHSVDDAMPADHHMMPGMVMDDEDSPASPAQELIMLNMRRDGSGTGWQPLDNPMLMKMGTIGEWTTMLHWNAFADQDWQTGPRGHNRFTSENWLMGSASRPLGEKTLLQTRAMLSFEPLTVGKAGMPELFQTGETYQGRALIDRQHPHDLFMEVSTQLWRQLGKQTWLRLYVAPVGEPALGPVAFPHRYSALLNPDAALSHHIQDSTHISFGVLTAGLVYKKIQWETSLFNGKEPDEQRYGFDFHKLTSFSNRLSWLLGEHWALQASHGRLDNPEQLEPGSVNRLTASIQHSKTYANGWLASALVFGHNLTSGSDENGVLLESTWHFRQRNYLFGRIETVSKHGFFQDHELAEQRFTLTKFTLGLARDLCRIKGVPITLGGSISVFGLPNGLSQAYGNFPIGFHVFLHTNAPRMSMGSRRMPNASRPEPFDTKN